MNKDGRICWYIYLSYHPASYRHKYGFLYRNGAYTFIRTIYLDEKSMNKINYIWFHDGNWNCNKVWKELFHCKYRRQTGITSTEITAFNFGPSKFHSHFWIGILIALKENDQEIHLPLKIQNSDGKFWEKQFGKLN